MKKDWKFLVENRFWNFGRKYFWVKKSKHFHWKNRFFSMQKSMKIRFFDFFDFSIFIDFCIENFQIFFADFFSIQNFKIDFRSKNFNFFHWFFFKPFKIPCRFRISQFPVARRPGGHCFFWHRWPLANMPFFALSWPFQTLRSVNLHLSTW